METEDLLLFDELCDVTQPSHNYFTIEQELIETKKKLKQLEDRLNKFENKNGSELSLSILPMKNPIRNDELYFCDVNCKEIKIDEKLYIFMDDCLICDIWDFKLVNHNIETNPSVRFLQQFKNVKTLIIDLSQSMIGGIKHHRSNTRSTEILINVCKIILNSNNCEIIFKSNDLYANGLNIEKLFKDTFLKSTHYTKLTVEIKNNLVINGGCASYQTQPYINETKSYCVKNKFIFTSNIGL